MMTITRKALISTGAVLPVLAMAHHMDVARAPNASSLRTPPRSDADRLQYVQMAYGQFDSPLCRRSSPCIFEGSCGFGGGTASSAPAVKWGYGTCGMNDGSFEQWMSPAVPL
jgi:hypothetical protein